MGLAAIDRVESQSLEESLPPVAVETEQVSDRFPSLQEQVAVASFCAVNLLLAKLILSLDFFAAIGELLPRIWAVLLIALSTVSLAFCFPPLLAAAIRDARNARFSVEVAKALIATLATFATIFALFFDFSRLSHHLLYESIPWLMLALTLEQYLFLLIEQQALENSGFSLLRLCKKVRRLEPYPDHAPVEALVAADVVKPGELFKLGTAEIVPCDGIIIEGTAELRERRYSGLPVPKFKSKGHRVYAGSEVMRGEILCEAAALSDDSTITSFTHVLNERIRQTNDKFELAESIETRLGLVLVAVAVCLGTYVSGAGQDLGVVATVLACVLSFALLLRAPRIWAHLPGLIHTTAFRRGMLFKDSEVVGDLSRVQNLVVDFRLMTPPGLLSVAAFDLIDERVDAQALYSVLLVLFGNSEEERSLVITEYLRSKVTVPALHKVSDLRIYDTRGISGNVGGIDFSIGSEAFLIERGVHLQPSEIASEHDGNEYLYVAMQDEIVARFVLAPHFTLDAQAMRNRLAELGVRSMLCSPDGADDIDKVGKRAGFELASIFGGLATEQFKERVESNSPAALLCAGERSEPEVVKAAAVTLRYFDDVRWNLEGADVLLLNQELSRISEMFLIARLSRSVRIIGLLVLGLALSTALGVMVWGVAAPSIIASVLILGVLLASLNHFRLLLP